MGVTGEVLSCWGGYPGDGEFGSDFNITGCRDWIAFIKVSTSVWKSTSLFGFATLVIPGLPRGGEDCG